MTFEHLVQMLIDGAGAFAGGAIAGWAHVKLLTRRTVRTEVAPLEVRVTALEGFTGIHNPQATEEAAHAAG